MNLLKVTQGKTVRHYNLDAVVWFEYEPDAPARRGAMAALTRAGTQPPGKSAARIRIAFQGTSSPVTISGPEAERLFALLAG